MNQKKKNNSESTTAKSSKLEKNKIDIATKQGSPLLESQNNALKKILEKLHKETK